jgi:hypothetical protein
MDKSVAAKGSDDDDEVDVEDEAGADGADEEDDDGEEADAPPSKKQRKKPHKTVGADCNVHEFLQCNTSRYPACVLFVYVATEYVTGSKMNICVTFQWDGEATQLKGKLVAYFKDSCAHVNLFALNQLINEQGELLFGKTMVVVRYKANDDDVWSTGKQSIDYS